MYTDFFTLILANYFRLNNFLYKSPPTEAAIFVFLTSFRIGFIIHFPVNSKVWTIDGTAYTELLHVVYEHISPFLEGTCVI